MNKEFGFFKNRDPDFMKAERMGQRMRGAFDHVPLGHLVRGNVLDAFNASNHRDGPLLLRERGDVDLPTIEGGLRGVNGMDGRGAYGRTNLI